MCKGSRIRILGNAKAPEVIGQEGLEGGTFVGLFAASFMVAILRVITGVVSALSTLNGTDMGLDNLALTKTHINFLPISALPPTARICKIAALLVQEAKLELESVGVVGKSVKKRWTGGRIL
ncbi:uncharacterized protein BcabD6B2_05200 [Babesia caballi]|uniref:Uncharacterized protein n=1 Tax=Babesia caballi TaxID=5871 RepID=A0AAV4LMQ5_BABCB|nr:hypothetical protein BcabD6B2_05200 [Babesia caballi]